jgi:hypothetical protein
MTMSSAILSTKHHPQPPKPAPVDASKELFEMLMNIPLSPFVPRTELSRARIPMRITRRP